MAGRLIEPTRHYRAAPNPTDRSVMGSASAGSATAAEYASVGFGRIQGIATFDSTPGPARVLLMQDSTKRIVRATEAAADGSYVFEFLDVGQTFSVLGEDYAHNYNSVIQARVTPVIPEP